jgi:hypothetical protein
LEKKSKNWQILISYSDSHLIDVLRSSTQITRFLLE